MCTYEVVAPSGVPQTKVVPLSIKAEVQLTFIASVVRLSLNFLHNMAIIAVFLMRQIDSWCVALTVDLTLFHWWYFIFIIPLNWMHPYVLLKNRHSQCYKCPFFIEYTSALLFLC